MNQLFQEKLFLTQCIFSYKTIPCINQTEDQHKEDQCIFYHSENDKRDSESQLSKEELENSSEILQQLQDENIHIINILKTLEEKFNKKILVPLKRSSLNQIEECFRIENYKLNQCDIKKCSNKYCPDYHNDTQKNEVKLIRKYVVLKIEHKENDFTVIFCPRKKKIHKFKTYTIFIQKKTIIKKKKISKIIKDFHCEPNYNNCKDFIYNQEVSMHENITVEFKQLKILDVEIALRYICAFLNTHGGKLYFGIKDNGLVRGMHLSRRDIDEFQILLDSNLRKFSPPVLLQEIRVNFYRICIDESCQYLIKNRYVVELIVKKGSSEEVYSNQNNKVFIKEFGSIQELYGRKLIEYCKGIFKISEKENNKSNQFYL